MANTMPNARLHMFDGGGHLLLLNEPSRVAHHHRLLESTRTA
jgi:hypothetical protein